MFLVTFYSDSPLHWVFCISSGDHTREIEAIHLRSTYLASNTVRDGIFLPVVRGVGPLKLQLVQIENLYCSILKLSSERI